jgi:hypothetical protein
MWASFGYVNKITYSVGLFRKRTYRPSDRRLLAKLVPTSADRGCHVVSVRDPYGRILGFLDRTYANSNKKTPWPQYARELYRPSDRRLSAKLMPTICDERVSCGQRDGSLRPYSRFSRPETNINCSLNIIKRLVLVTVGAAIAQSV